MVHDTYAGRVSSFGALLQDAVRRRQLIGRLRLALFIALAVVGWQVAKSGANAGALATGAVGLVAFGVLVRRSNTATAAVLRYEGLVAVNEEAIHRVARNWDALEIRLWDAVPPTHPYAVDLDLFGKASLAQLFPALSPVPGRRTLASWLLAPAESPELMRRQQAVAELTPNIEWRDELIVHARRIVVPAARLQAFQHWAGSPGWLSAKRSLLLASIALPVTTLVLIVAEIAGVVNEHYFLVSLTLGFVLTARFGKTLRTSMSHARTPSYLLESYAAMMNAVVTEQFQSEELLGIQRELGGAVRSMRSLRRLNEASELSASPMLYVVVHALTLWDFHIVRLLEQWQQQSGAHVGQWMEALGRAESLTALATMAHDNPDWTFPVVAAGRESLSVQATGLGHPLLNEASRVANDVAVGPPGTMLVVTGSNMAGKSTLLRSIGLNVVLAQAGGVVCASAMRCPPVALYSSMRVQDSIERGVSYFMAELERLKLIVDAADAATPSRTLLYLLDEILHGTNSAERAVAARHVLAHLVATGAIGAVSTHDLELADARELADVAHHVHFREQFVQVDGARSTMQFDYRLRPGKATSSNALALLELVGLGKVLSAESSQH